MKPQLLTVTEVAVRFGAGKSTIWRWAQNGSIPKPIKVGGATRWRLADITDFIEQAQDAV